MPAAPTEMNLSILGSRFQQPIADLIVRLIARPYSKPDRLGSSHYEGGYSASGIILLAAMIESLIQRDRYFHKQSSPSAKPSTNAPEYLKTTLGYRRHAQVKELFEVRNALAHNHVWEVHYSLPRGGGRQHKSSSLVAGTHRLASPPPATAKVPRTSTNRFNLLPSRIDRTDLLKSLTVCVHLLEFLAKKGNRPVNLAQNTIVLPKSRPPFSALISVVRDAL